MITAGQFIRGATVVTGDVYDVLKRELDFHRVRPTASLLFLTYRCNSRCKTCTAWKRDQNEEIKHEIGFSKWRRIIDRLDEAGVKTTELFGGNVLLRRDLLIELLQYLEHKKFNIHLPTNQIGLDERTANIIADCANTVYISTDGIDGHQDAIRGYTNSFRLVEHAISRLRRYRKKKGKPRLVCNTTVSKFNVGCLEQIVEYATAAGFDEIDFEYAGEFCQQHVERSTIEGLKPTPYFLKQDESVLVDRAGARRLKENLRTIKEKYKNRGINIVTVNIDILSEIHLVSGTVRDHKCYMERNEVTLDPSGNVIICPFFTNYRLGNLIDEPLQKIWNNERHKKFRTFQNKARPEICKHCILCVQKNPGVLTSLKRIYLSRIEPKLAITASMTRRV